MMTRILVMGVVLCCSGAAAGKGHHRRAAPSPPPPSSSSSPAVGPGTEAKPAVEAVAPPAQAAAGAVAVLEYRSAVEQVPDLTEQLSQALARNTSLRVIGLREGRQRIGAKLDGEVAACAGEASCLAEVGRRMGVGEVLLAAVSQLGDVVLALQRIDVTGKGVRARVADSMPIGQALTEVRVLGWLQQLYPPETFKRYGQINVSADVAGAQLYINARPRGKTPLDGPVRVLAPGSYRLLLERSQYLPFQASVTVMPDTTVDVSAHLSPEVKARPWYRRWYVWTAIGAAAVAGVSVGMAVYYGAFYEGPPDMTKVPAEVVFK
jgi:hypothetical protein